MLLLAQISVHPSEKSDPLALYSSEDDCQDLGNFTSHAFSLQATANCILANVILPMGIFLATVMAWLSYSLTAKYSWAVAYTSHL